MALKYWNTPVQAVCAVGVVALTGAAVWLLFTSETAVAVAAPSPTSSSAQAQCAALAKLLPQTVAKQSRRDTDPASPLTAAWGSPAITLRCGVPEPSILIPHSKNYNPQADEVDVNNVAWLIEQNSDGGYRFTAAQRAVYIEVDVPIAYGKSTDALVDVSGDVLKAVPRNDGTFGDDVAPAATSS